MQIKKSLHPLARDKDCNLCGTTHIALSASCFMHDHARFMDNG
jgi:hypothetical protein